MASIQKYTFVEKHIEKILVALAVAAFAFIIYRYGIGTPRQVTRNARQAAEGGFPPAELDRQILDYAESVERQIQEAESPEKYEPHYVHDVKRLQDSPPFPKNNILTNLSFPRREGIKSDPKIKVVINPPTVEELRAELQKVVPAKPLGWIGTELVLLGQDRLGELVILRGASAYRWDRLMQLWEAVFKKRIPPPTLSQTPVAIVSYEVEFQEKQFDGTWKTVDLNLLQAGRRPNPEEFVPEYDQANADAVFSRLLETSRDTYAVPALQPDFFDVLVGQRKEPWTAHFPLQIFRDYRKQRDVAPTGTGPTEDKGDDTGVPAIEGTVIGGGDTPGKKRDTTGNAAPVAGAGGVTVEIPSIQEQYEKGTVLAWFHAYRLEYGAEYRFRMRLQISNPLLTRDKDVKEDRKEDAFIRFLYSPWSAWSDTFSVERKVDFYITGRFPVGQKLSLALVTTAMGQPVTAKLSKLEAGSTIGGEFPVEILDPRNPERIQEITVDFNTGAISVAHNFDKRVDVGGMTRNTVEMIYLDSNGELRSRLMYNDRKKFRSRTKEIEAIREKMKQGGKPSSGDAKLIRRKTQKAGPAMKAPARRTKESGADNVNLRRPPLKRPGSGLVRPGKDREKVEPERMRP